MLANTTNDWAKVYCGAFEKAGIKKIGVLADDTATIAALNKALFDQMSCVADRGRPRRARPTRPT